MTRIVYKEFVRHVLPGVLKPIRILWNEIIGFVFIVLAILMGSSTYRNFSDAKYGPLPLIGSVLFVGLLFYFGVSSFLRARKIGKS